MWKQSHCSSAKGHAKIS
ncbi:uncharacterized protein RCC_03428 [Ramularia collo-cygni]|uniref:Uncharacterized protein n=1 Tax=Ramularia collo-cygni TaxID=112498 RepID=A0A2D3V508_9PEZI|nr:uncharacterized protein RCC_03428 [Ramularia collo-cygni]